MKTKRTRILRLSQRRIPILFLQMNIRKNKRRREARENAADAKKVDAASKKELDAARRNPLSLFYTGPEEKTVKAAAAANKRKMAEKEKSPAEKRGRVKSVPPSAVPVPSSALVPVARPISLNFAPEGERSDDHSGQNIVHWEGQLDDYRTVHFIRKTFESKFPTKLHPQSAGYDLYCQSGALLKAGEMILMDIGIQVKLPLGHVGLIKPRSGLALRHKIDVMGGVVDEDFEGTLGVMLINHGKLPYQVELGDRVAQFLIIKLHNLPLKKSTYDEIITTTAPVASRRGAKGYGSSGK
ncbi:Deoxyuridine 5'-triphosphate nucleotidohydrolase [Folsomia candida]|uniref:Deoxyuridine 5'-triphosphate nucleotidohydrolase n=1 Tax=Folsomia candida TaxID=158441 RepID=A0A226DQ75_FOLCA|nr:Deoxyuridine 5'-triphosphate nucleotidohydrolase [Folsomia candida]